MSLNAPHEKPDFSVVVFWGIRIFLPGDTDFAPLQSGEDARLRVAQKHQLDARLRTYCEDPLDENFCLLIGKQLACVGQYGDFEKSIDEPTFRQILDDTNARLKQAGFSDTPSLHIQCDPDV